MSAVSSEGLTGSLGLSGLPLNKIRLTGNVSPDSVVALIKVSGGLVDLIFAILSCSFLTYLIFIKQKLKIFVYFLYFFLLINIVTLSFSIFSNSKYDKSGTQTKNYNIKKNSFIKILLGKQLSKPIHVEAHGASKSVLEEFKRVGGDINVMKFKKIGPEKIKNDKSEIPGSLSKTKSKSSKIEKKQVKTKSKDINDKANKSVTKSSNDKTTKTKKNKSPKTK